MSYAMHLVHRPGSSYKGAKDFRRYLEEDRAPRRVYNLHSQAVLAVSECARGADGKLSPALTALLARIPTNGAAHFVDEALAYDNRKQLYVLHM